MTETGSPKFVGAVENGVKILRHLSNAGEPEGVASIARSTCINVSTAFNILRTLAKENLVSFDQKNKTYQLSLGVLEFSLPLIGRSQAELIQPLMNRLVERHQLVIALWTLTSNERIVLQSKSVPENSVRIDLKDGSRLPAYAGAAGRCYAASGDWSTEGLKAKYDSLNWANAPGFEAYLADVELARKERFSVDCGDLFAGVDIAAALIHDPSGKPVLGLSAIALADQHTKDGLREIGRDLSESCRLVEKLLFSKAGA